MSVMPQNMSSQMLANQPNQMRQRTLNVLELQEHASQLQIAIQNEENRLKHLSTSVTQKKEILHKMVNAIQIVAAQNPQYLGRDSGTATSWTTQGDPAQPFDNGWHRGGAATSHPEVTPVNHQAGLPQRSDQQQPIPQRGPGAPLMGQPQGANGGATFGAVITGQPPFGQVMNNACRPNDSASSLSRGGATSSVTAQGHSPPSNQKSSKVSLLERVTGQIRYLETVKEQLELGLKSGVPGLPFLLSLTAYNTQTTTRPPARQAFPTALTYYGLFRSSHCQNAAPATRVLPPTTGPDTDARPSASSLRRYISGIPLVGGVTMTALSCPHLRVPDLESFADSLTTILQGRHPQPTSSRTQTILSTAHRDTVYFTLALVYSLSIGTYLIIGLLDATIFRPRPNSIPILRLVLFLCIFISNTSARDLPQFTGMDAKTSCPIPCMSPTNAEPIYAPRSAAIFVTGYAPRSAAIFVTGYAPRWTPSSSPALTSWGPGSLNTLTKRMPGSNVAAHRAGVSTALQEVLKRLVLLLWPCLDRYRISAFEGTDADGLERVKLDFKCISLPNMPSHEVPPDQRVAYDSTLKQLFPLVSDMEVKLPLFYALVKQEEVIRKLVAMVSSPELRQMLAETTRLNDMFVNAVRMVQLAQVHAQQQSNYLHKYHSKPPLTCPHHNFALLSLSTLGTWTIEHKQAHPSNTLPVTNAPRRMAQQVPTTIECKQAHPSNILPVTNGPRRMAQQVPTTAVKQAFAQDHSSTSITPSRWSQSALLAEPSSTTTAVPGFGQHRQSPWTTRPDSSQNSSSKQWKAPHSDPNTPSPSHSNTTSPASSASPQTPLNLETDSARIQGGNASPPSVRLAVKALTLTSLLSRALGLCQLSPLCPWLSYSALIHPVTLYPFNIYSRHGPAVARQYVTIECKQAHPSNILPVTNAPCRMAQRVPTTIERKQAHPSNILPVTNGPRRMAQQVPTTAVKQAFAQDHSSTSITPSRWSQSALLAEPSSTTTAVPGFGQHRQSPWTTRPDSSQNSSSKQWKAPHSDPNTPSPSHSNTTSPASSASPQTPLNLETDSARIQGGNASPPSVRLAVKALTLTSLLSRALGLCQLSPLCPRLSYSALIHPVTLYPFNIYSRHGPAVARQYVTIERKQAHPSNILPVTNAPRRMAQRVPTTIERKQAHPSNILPVTNGPRRMAQQVPTNPSVDNCILSNFETAVKQDFAQDHSSTSITPSRWSQSAPLAEPSGTSHVVITTWPSYTSQPSACPPTIEVCDANSILVADLSDTPDYDYPPWNGRLASVHAQDSEEAPPKAKTEPPKRRVPKTEASGRCCKFALRSCTHTAVTCVP
ncbi:hypothetical protein DFP72DRAFT_852344 [Ephemerocybe angulata]|uniref:Uncharacterized protein n=1 Tax=Ephemerocybe angulata TaxID=980116 RepID=A0A8H6M2E9_9AGAR|nr:hypothetical protein DFP72DRAFT_852344 [Tulosesus angulatus]